MSSSKLKKYYDYKEELKPIMKLLDENGIKY